MYDDACLKELIYSKLILVVANLCNFRFLVFRRNIKLVKIYCNF